MRAVHNHGTDNSSMTRARILCPARSFPRPKRNLKLKMGNNQLLYHRLPLEILVEIFIHCLPPDEARLSKPSQLLPPFTLARVCSLWRNLVLRTPQLWSRIVLGRCGTGSSKEIALFEYWLGRAGAEKSSVPLDILLTPQGDDAISVLLDEEANERYERDTTVLTEKLCAVVHRLRSVELNVLGAKVLEPLFIALGGRAGASIGALRIISRVTGTVATAPLLEELDLTSVHLSGARDVRILTNLARNCPRLRTVSLMCPTLLPAAPLGDSQTQPDRGPDSREVLHSMRVLKLRFCTAVSHALSWLDVCPNLERFKALMFVSPTENEGDPEMEEFDDIDDELDEDGWVVVNHPPPRVDGLARSSPAPRRNLRLLSHLTHLDLHCFFYPSVVGDLLYTLHTPALKHLRVSTSKSLSPSRQTQTGRWLHAALLLQLSQPPLEELEIIGGAMTVDDVRTCLMLTPYLRRLCVGVCGELDSLLEDMTIRRLESENSRSILESGAPEKKERAKQSSLGSASSTLLCPRLEVLDIADATYSINRLASMVSSRFARHKLELPDSELANTDSTDIRCLKELVIETSAVRDILDHPLIADCVAHGLVVTEREPDILLGFGGTE